MLAIAYNWWVGGPWTGEHAGVIALYDVATGRHITVLSGHASLVSALASGSKDGTAIVWNVPGGDR